jgi:tRNA A37 threonylcarbamoyladenosine dehydratase
MLGEDGVRVVGEARIALVGLAGGVASQIALHLTRTGCRNVTIIDDEKELSRVVDVEMLTFDVSLTHEDVVVGRTRIEALRQRVTAILPHIDVAQANDINNADEFDMIVYCSTIEKEISIVKQINSLVSSKTVNSNDNNDYNSATKSPFILLIADWRFQSDATRLRVSSLLDTTIDDRSARLVRRLLLRSNVRCRVGLVHANSSSIGFGANNVAQRIVDNAAAAAAPSLAYSPLFATSLGAIVASHTIGCITDAFDTTWHNVAARQQPSAPFRKAHSKLTRRYKHQHSDDQQRLPPVTAIEYIIDCVWNCRSSLSLTPLSDFVVLKWHDDQV